MTTSDTLRQAADRLATIAGAADPRGEWYTADALTALGIPADDAALIAVMTPRVALLLAEHLLDIDYAISYDHLEGDDPTMRLARTILGEP